MKQHQNQETNKVTTRETVAAWNEKNLKQLKDDEDSVLLSAASGAECANNAPERTS